MRTAIEGTTVFCGDLHLQQVEAVLPVVSQNRFKALFAVDHFLGAFPKVVVLDKLARAHVLLLSDQPSNRATVILLEAVILALHIRIFNVTEFSSTFLMLGF